MAWRRKIRPMMGMKYSFDARFELARSLSAIFQRSVSKLIDADQVVGDHGSWKSSDAAVPALGSDVAASTPAKSPPPERRCRG